MKEQFAHHLEKLYQGVVSGLSPLRKTIRQRTWDQFLKIGLPEKNKPGYQYFPFNHFYKESYEIAVSAKIQKEQFAARIHPECKRSCLVFLNGRYSAELSDTSALPAEVALLDNIQALTNYATFVQGRIARFLKEETDPFVLLSICLNQTGVIVYIPPNVVIDPPIQCLYLFSHDRPSLASPCIHFFLGKRANVKVIRDYHSLKDTDYLSSGIFDVTLEEGAVLEHYGTLNPSSNGWCLEATRVTQKRDSQFKSLTCTTGTKSVRQDFRVALMGENASCDLKGVSLLSDHNQSHLNIVVNHEAPHCQSNQHFKNVLTGSSRASFEGKIFVQPEAQKTAAYQLNNNLLLSDKAIANSKPNLEIFADDVKASHGATFTQLNPEHLLYLKTRGISADAAKLLLLSGFSLDIFSQISLPVVRERMQHLVAEYVV